MSEVATITCSTCLDTGWDELRPVVLDLIARMR